ncbi:MAG: HAMP domain-containing sensor histidine kinase [Eubacteriales bacterium]|nr:HAMP domain-containing sensor histidine kinase [Eubacteriales bacterium]
MRKKRKSRLSVKVFLLTFVLILACCFVTYCFLAWAVPKNYQYDLEDAEWWICFLPDDLAGESSENAPIWLEETEKSIREQYENEFELHFFRADGQEVSLGNVNQLTGGQMEDFEKAEKSKAYTIRFADSNSPYTLLLTRNLAKRTETEKAIQRTLPPLCMVVLAGAAIAAFFCSWYLTAPIKKVSRRSKQMAELDFSGVCVTGRTDEIGVLADSLNTLSRKLEATLSELQEANRKLQADIAAERQLERQRTAFFSAASHELKTPITILKGQLQGMLYQVGRYKDRETYLKQSLETADTLETMVQELLTISRLDTPGYCCRKAKIDLSGLLKERLLTYEDFFMQKELTITRAIMPGLAVWGDLSLLQKALDNLLGNAAAYSEAGNQVSVHLWGEAGKARLTVENTGASIPEEEIPRLFEAFYRVEPSRNRQTGGTGLGLYIVKKILELHGAEISIANSAQGVLVSVQFPTIST